jgi:Fic family protein
LKINNKWRNIETQVGRKDAKDRKELDKRKQAKAIEHYFKIVSKLEKSIEHKQGEKTSKFLYLQEELDLKIVQTLERMKIDYKIMLKTLEPEELELINEQMFYHHVAGTTQIEGNPLEFEEVELLLRSKGSTGIENRDLKDQTEINNFETLRHVLTMSNISRTKVSEKTIKKIHRILMSGLYHLPYTRFPNLRLPIRAGHYRKNQNVIPGATIATARPDQIKPRIQKLIQQYEFNEENKTIHPLENIILFHHRFEQIHPFSDGNGRVGRELLNIMLNKKGYPPIYIRKSDNKYYRDSLREADMNNYVPIMKFLLVRIIASLQFYFSRTSMNQILKLDISLDAIP